LDALRNGEVGVGCSGCVDEMLFELSDELVAPSCTGLVEVHVRNGLGLVVLWTYISRRAVLAFPNTNCQPAMTKSDHKGLDIISEYRRG
jgi:hypothetical protein